MLELLFFQEVLKVFPLYRKSGNAPAAGTFFKKICITRNFKPFISKTEFPKSYRSHGGAGREVLNSWILVCDSPDKKGR